MEPEFYVSDDGQTMIETTADHAIEYRWTPDEGADQGDWVEVRRLKRQAVPA